MRHHVDRGFLIIVRRQPVIIGCDERVKKLPGFACEFAQKMLLLCIEHSLLSDPWPTDPPGDERRDEPQRQEGCSDRQRVRSHNDDEECNGTCSSRCDPHRPIILEDFRQVADAVAYVFAQISRRVAGGIPL